MSENNVLEYRNLIGGVWQGAENGRTIDLFCPCDGSPVSRVPDSGTGDVDRAVAAARDAFEHADWAFNPRLRSRCLGAWAAAMRANHEALAVRLALETGKPIGEARFELNSSIGYVEYYAAAARTLYGTSTAVEAGLLSVLAREPVGVVAAITPWNYPVTLLMRDMAPALAAGCTCVLKPATQTTGCTLAVLELLDGIPEFPKGVVNAVSGRGSVVGDALTRHPDVDMISLTGGLETGREVMKTAAATMKKISLELGGKSPNVIFADADLDKALPFALKAIFMNAGQLCTVGSRLVLEESLVDTFLPRLKEEVEKLRPGYCMDENTNLGPVISREQMDKIMGYIEIGKQCSTLVTGGRRLTENGLDKGFYIAPTIFLNPPMDSPIVQEEIFGPVLVVQTFRTKEEALAIANGTAYGLASAVWSRDIDKAMWVARRLRAGSAWVNCYNKLLPECETGGYKQSGMDRAGGAEGMLKYTEVKHLCVDFK